MPPDEIPDPPVRPASTVIVVRPAGSSFEVLMVRRRRGATFMGNARVFPGGALEPQDRQETARRAISWTGDPEELPWRSAALRELAEEAGVFVTSPPDVTISGASEDPFRRVIEAGASLDADRLVYLSNWVTPKGPPRRFDTRFYLARVGADVGAAADEIEVFDAEWVTPAEALHRAEHGSWSVEFPTRRHLELLDRFRLPEDLLNYARQQDQVARIEPRVLASGDGSWRVVLQGEPGYEEGLR